MAIHLDYLFSGEQLFDVFQQRLVAARTAIERLPAETILNTPHEDLVDAVTDSMDYEALAIDEGGIWMTEPAETKVNVAHEPLVWNPRGVTELMVPGTRIEMYVPFSGSPELLTKRASTFSSSGGPRGAIRGQDILMVWEGRQAEAGPVNAYFERELAALRQQMGWVNNDLTGFRTQLRSTCSNQISARRQRIEHDRGLVGSLKFPVRKRGQPAPRAVPVVRKRISLDKVKQRPQSAYQDEYLMEDVVYEEVIAVLLNMGIGFERSPKTFGKLHEPELRDHLLLHLNGTFEGAGGGELFNGSGKTDILVRVENRNVFIGECKIWDGEVAFNEAIDQLLGYTVWRDSKAALLIFIKQKDAGSIIEKADAAIKNHPNYKRLGAASDDPAIRRNYVLHQCDDPNREIRVALLPFVIRASPE